MLPASAVPVIVGRVWFVRLPSAGAVIAGAAGAVRSIVKGTGAVVGLSFPAASRSVAVAWCAPSSSAWPTVSV